MGVISGALSTAVVVGGLTIAWMGVGAHSSGDMRVATTDSITGPLRVIDGDTVAIGREKIRLFGIDAPEKGQTCTDHQDRDFNCGKWVSHIVHTTYTGRTATCALTEVDRYGRRIGQCSVAGRDLGQRLVADGLAFAYRKYSDLYVVDEAAAREAGRGLHRYDMAQPSIYRAALRDRPQAAPRQDCEIKGNISGNGHIFHQPGQRDYDRVRINPAKGERWFCSTLDAEKAGWRPARR